MNRDRRRFVTTRGHDRYRDSRQLRWCPVVSMTAARRLGFALLVTVLSGAAAAQRGVSVGTAHDSERENQTRAQLTRLLGAYDLDDWIFTTSVVIDERAIPHSHPVLTLHTRHNENDLHLLSTFVHEQIHWHLVTKSDQTKSAIGELMKVFPSAPTGGTEGASNTESTYLHLIVNYLEFQAMKDLVGDRRAREVFDFWTTDHYTWIYRTVLSDEEQIGAVVTRHALGI